MAGEGPRSGDYRMARIGAAVALTVVVVVTVLIDAISPDYNVDPSILAIMATAICTLLGVEFIQAIQEGRQVSVYRPPFQPQLNPADPYGNVNCTAYAAATVIAFDTQGRASADRRPGAGPDERADPDAR